MIQKDTKLMMPKGSLKSKEPLVLDMTTIYKAESRLIEVSYVAPDKAQELMGFLNVAASDSSKFSAQVQFELLNAQREYDRRKAVLLLDVFGDYIKEKGIKPNEDIREAFILSDDIISDLRTRIDMLKAAAVLLDNKVFSFIRAFNATKMIVESKRYNATSKPLTTSSLMDESLGYNTFEGEE